MVCSSPGSSVHGDSPGKNTGVGCHSLLQGSFPTEESNPGLPYYRWILYHLSHQGSPPHTLTPHSLLAEGIYSNCPVSDSTTTYSLTWVASPGGIQYYKPLIFYNQYTLNFFVIRRIYSPTPRWHSGKESTYQCRRCKFDPWVRKIPWRRKWTSTPILPGKFHGQESGELPSRDHKELDATEHAPTTTTTRKYLLWNLKELGLNPQFVLKIIIMENLILTSSSFKD